MAAEAVVEHYSTLVDRRLEGYLLGVVERSKGYHPFINDVYETLREYLLRKGKRLASCSTLFTYEGYSGMVDDKILDVTVAIEFYRHSILIHDDLVDRDEWRRGGRALHALYADRYDWRFGEALAVFCGNILLSQALTALWSAQFERPRILQASEMLTEDYLGVNESQILDLLFEYKTPKAEEWRVMASKRAASLFRATMGVGALLGGAPAQDVQKVKEAATHIGYAFDIQDDIIGTFASEEQYGRPLGGDILLGKKPLHIVYAYEMASEPELRELERVLRAKRLGKEEIEAVRGIVRGCGALERAEEALRGEARKGLGTLEETSMLPKSKERLRGLVEFVTGSLDWYK